MKPCFLPVVVNYRGYWLARKVVCDRNILILSPIISKLPICTAEILCFFPRWHSSSSRDSSVGIMTVWKLDNPGVMFDLQHGTRFISSPKASFHYDLQWVPEAVFLGEKRLGREVYHSPSYSAEVKNEWSYTSTPT